MNNFIYHTENKQEKSLEIGRALDPKIRGGLIFCGKLKGV